VLFIKQNPRTGKERGFYFLTLILCSTHPQQERLWIRAVIFYKQLAIFSIKTRAFTKKTILMERLT
ncbi:hypothetical protein, partial [Escherichia coli]|uniref:hypothetical protein n=1 Tax=Escherichia coli TaxID=562 RepID=UPI001BB0AE1C